MRAEAHFVFEYDIPDHPDLRISIYGTSDIDECIKIDAEKYPTDMMECLADFGQLTNYTIELVN